MPNYLQRMAGRLGSGMGIDPRRRMAQQLFAQGVDTSPAHLGTGIGRLGKALAAAYMMRQSQDQEADAMKWLTAEQPDRFRQPTRAEALEARPDLEMLRLQAASPYLTGDIPPSVSKSEDWITSAPPDPIVSPAPIVPPDQPKEFRSSFRDWPEQLSEKEKDEELRKTFAKSEAEGVTQYGDDLTESVSVGVPQRDLTGDIPDYAKQLASGMEAYQGAEANQISDPRTRMEWLRESYRNNPELQNNWFVMRMLKNLMFNEMQRDISQEDIKSKRGFTTSERLAGEKFKAGESELDRKSRERAAKLRAVGEDPNAWKLWLKADKLSDEKFEKFLLTRRGYNPRDIGGTLYTPSLSKPDQGVGEEKKITLGPEQEPGYIQEVEDIKLDAKYMDDLKRMQPKASGLLDSFKQKTAFMKDNIEQAIANISGWSTAYGAMLQGWPRTQAQALGTLLTTIKANVGFQALQEMRANSPTGGALGQVSERELAYLQATLGDIAQTQDGAILAQKLKAMQKQIEGMSERLQQAYDMTFAPLQGSSAIRPSPVPPVINNRRKGDDPMDLGL